MTPSPEISLAPDPALHASVFWFRHKSEIIAAFLVVLVALAAVAGYWTYQQRRDAAAADSLAKAKTASDFTKVSADFPGTPAGGTALLLLAEQQRNEKKYAEANVTLQSFVEKQPKHELVSTARMAIAANLESLHKPDEAAAMYQRVSAGDPRGFNAPLALLAQVHLLKDKHQIEEARRVCETVLTQYRDSFAAGEATRQLRTLKPVQPLAAGPTVQPGGTPSVSAPVAAGSSAPGSAAPSPPKP